MLCFVTFGVQYKWEFEVFGEDSIIVVDNILVSLGRCPLQAQNCDFEYKDGVDEYCGGKVIVFLIIMFMIFIIIFSYTFCGRSF